MERGVYTGVHVKKNRFWKMFSGENGVRLSSVYEYGLRVKYLNFL
jgi:hypothetical protein